MTDLVDKMTVLYYINITKVKGVNMNKIKMQEAMLLKELQLKGKVSLKEVMLKFGFSESTARRLFTRTEKNGIGIRSFGYIQLVSEEPFNIYSYESSEAKRLKEKKAIAAEAVKLLKDGDSIFLDSGTTVFQFTVMLNDVLLQSKLKNIKVFTNSLSNLNVLQKTATVNLIGGEYRPNRRDFCGYVTEKTIKDYHFDKCFLGTDGFALKNGFTTTDFNTSRISQAAITNSDKSFILMDSSKFNTPSTISFSTGKDIFALICDEKATKEQKEICYKSGISIIVAKIK